MREVLRKSPAKEGLRVAQEMAAIRAALHERGYRTRKQPRQPIWRIYVSAQQFYQLSFQPAPLSCWVLYPQSHSAERQTLLTIIQSVLSKQPTGIVGRVS